ncbi:MAG: peptidase, partial [Cytophagales bacterium]|nr:peptidase [Cytophagales bacterium]
GNWVEIGEATPFVIIGNSGYGKPILNRVIKYDTSMQFALKTGFLSFDSTRKSANDVDYPIDVIIYKNNSFNIKEHRFEKEDLQEVSLSWERMLSESVNKIPDEWMNPVFSK